MIISFQRTGVTHAMENPKNNEGQHLKGEEAPQWEEDDCPQDNDGLEKYASMPSKVNLVDEAMGGLQARAKTLMNHSPLLSELGHAIRVWCATPTLS